MAMGRQKEAPIFASSWLQCGTTLPLGLGEAEGPTVQLFGNMREAAPSSTAINPHLRGLAETIHESWRGAGSRALHEMSMTKQLSNYRAAVHALLKLRLLGFTGIDPEKPNFGLAGELDKLEQLAIDRQAMARFEHIRWCADRSLDGWLPSDGERPERERRHMLLAEGREKYAELSDGEKKKDDRQITSIIDYVRGELPVGFFGHIDLEGRIDLPRQLLEQRVRSYAESLQRDYPGKRLHLVTGLAEGADQLAIRIWKKEGYGPVTGIVPEDFATSPQEAGVDRLKRLGDAESDAGHAERAAWIIERCRHALAISDGVDGGVGGTANSVSLAEPSRLALANVGDPGWSG